MKPGTKIGVGLSALVWLGVASIGAPQQQPVFRSGTRLVEVAVTVVDKKGNGVTGLQAADFEVFDQGKPRKVDVFRFDGAPAEPARTTTPTLPAGTFTNLPTFADQAPRHVAALVLDNINTTPLQGVTARRLLIRYLKTLAPQTTTAVYLMADKLHVLHDFTDDATALRARLEKMTLPNPTAWDMDPTQSIINAEAFLKLFPGSDREAMKGVAAFGLRTEALADAQIRKDQALRSLAQAEALGTHLAGISGRKSLVWIGGGLSMVSVTASLSQKTPELVESLEAEVRQVSRRLAQQGVVLYIVDAHRVESVTSDMRPQSSQPLPQRGRGNFELLADTAAISNDSQGAMQTLATITGGRYFYPENPTAGIDKVLGDMQGGYTLGFYVTEKADDKWHKLKVQVKRSGLNVRYREGYLADSRDGQQPAKWTEDTWKSALSNPLGSPAIPLTVACSRRASGELALRLAADSRSLQFVPAGDAVKTALEVMIADRTAVAIARTSRWAVTRPVPAADLDTARQQPTRWDLTWTPAADATSLRVIVHDVNSGRYGSLDVALSKVPGGRPD